MNIEDLSKESLKKFYERKFGENLTKQGNCLDIPEDIKLDSYGDIIFNDGRQVLHISYGLIAISNESTGFNDYSDEFELQSIEFEDIKCGDTIVIADEDYDLEELENWHKVDERKRGMFINDEEDYQLETYELQYENTYKVVRKDR